MATRRGKKVGSYSRPNVFGSKPKRAMAKAAKTQRTRVTGRKMSANEKGLLTKTYSPKGKVKLGKPKVRKAPARRIRKVSKLRG